MSYVFIVQQQYTPKAIAIAKTEDEDILDVTIEHEPFLNWKTKMTTFDIIEAISKLEEIAIDETVRVLVSPVIDHTIKQVEFHYDGCEYAISMVNEEDSFHDHPFFYTVLDRIIDHVQKKNKLEVTILYQSDCYKIIRK